MTGTARRKQSTAKESDERMVSDVLMVSTSASFDDRPVRTVLLNGQPWFVSSDVCAALEIANPRDTLRRLDPDEKGKVRLVTSGGEQEMNVVNESGLYLLTFNSRKPEAAKFRKWVTSEVLPSLRKAATGEPQDTAAGSAYCRIPGPGHFRVTLGETGRLMIYEIEPDRFVPDFYSAEVDALALATCLVGAIWRKFQMLDALSALNSERSNSRYQLGEAIKQAQHIAQSTMRTKVELVDSRTT